MTACDPKVTLAPSASGVRFLIGQLVNPNTTGANLAPAANNNKVPPYRALPHFRLVRFGRASKRIRVSHPGAECRLTAGETDRSATRGGAKLTSAIGQHIFLH